MSISLDFEGNLTGAVLVRSELSEEEGLAEFMVFDPTANESSILSHFILIRGLSPFSKFIVKAQSNWVRRDGRPLRFVRVSELFEDEEEGPISPYIPISMFDFEVNSTNRVLKKKKRPLPSAEYGVSYS